MENRLSIVNGLQDRFRSFDSNFKFYRGNVKSQNDWCITNAINNVVSFTIIPKLTVSDHCPLSLKMYVPKATSMQFLYDVSVGNYSNDHYDRSKFLKARLKLENINTDNLSGQFNDIAEYISSGLDNGSDINNLVSSINDRIYKSCSVRRKERNVIRIPETKKNLQSWNFRAIADANIKMYNVSIQRGDEAERSLEYFQTWKLYNEYAKIKEEEEFNTKINSTWRYKSKHDPKQLWKTIDYKDKNNKGAEDKNYKQKETTQYEKIISEYFTAIFQAEKLSNNPTIADISESLTTYNVYNPLLDDELTMDELNMAIQKNGRGTGVDSIDKKMAILFNLKLRKSILQLFNVIFSTEYPIEWTKQLLRPEEKKGHSENDPKLRGVAISQLLPTLYDIILFNRFNMWYSANPEQAAQPKQGCLLQIFSIYIVMEYVNSIGLSLYVGFLDYEKAFDFVNRANIINHLKENEAGATFVKAVASMYRETSYIPRIGNRIGEAIVAKHGVTQGRQTSSLFFSFEVHDLAKSINCPSSKVKDYNVLQLADDTALMAEEKTMQCTQFNQCLKFSKDNYMIPNTDKTYFLHLSKEPDLEPILLHDGTTIQPAIDNEHIYLGMKFITSDDITDHIKKNLQDRSFHIKRFYEWLEVNEYTPIKIKLQTLYSCMFNAYLYGCETWWKIDDVKDQLLLIERKLIKSILCVKSNTPDDLLYMELDRVDIITIIKSRQNNFFKRISTFEPEEAIVKKILQKHGNLPICTYYANLDGDIVQTNKDERLNRVRGANATYLTRYRELVDVKLNHIIYDSCIPEHLRVIITRWRLSNHQLQIEMGRRQIPKQIRELRKCLRCNILEDEHHVFYSCNIYDDIRENFREYIRRYPLVGNCLNPTNIGDAVTLGNYIWAIEKRREELGMQERHL